MDQLKGYPAIPISLKLILVFSELRLFKAITICFLIICAPENQATLYKAKIISDKDKSFLGKKFINFIIF
jgi:hypothetical protein